MMKKEKGKMVGKRTRDRVGSGKRGEGGDGESGEKEELKKT
jgi:hypothetical protein